MATAKAVHTLSRMKTVTAVLADDQRAVRDAVRVVLESDLEVNVVGEAANVDAAERSVVGSEPSLLLLDLNMPGGSTLELIPRLAARSPATRTILLTMQDDAEVAHRALAAGARGYVLKQEGSAGLLDAIRTVLRGGTYLSPALS